MLTAYHGQQAEKDAILAQLALHREADQIVKGQYWQDGKGCAVGCTIHSSDHMEYERRFGIPMMLARLEDTIFEGLPNAEAMLWPERFMGAIAPGADLSRVGWQLLHWQLTDATVFPGIAHPLVADVVRQCASVIEPLTRGEAVDWRAARSAESAASAASAARSAERAARSLARSGWSAACAASAARSAESAAWSAAWAASAESAAWSAASAARSAESAAASAAACAARSALSAAWSAASAARAAESALSAASAARSAESAAESAAQSEMSAAWNAASAKRSATWVNISDKLIALIEDAPRAFLRKGE